MGKLEVLQKFLNDNKDKLPKPAKGVKTLFDIMKQPHLENVWSNIYAFFFNPTEEHNLKSLFFETLKELIITKDGRNFCNMCDIKVKTEVSTNDRKRIDIVIESNDCAIIIENKVYATLYNPLDSYWDKYELPDSSKQGVVLSLYDIEIDEKHKEKWVNITHCEFMEAVKKRLKDQSIPENYKVLLFEFMQNINNMKTPIKSEIQEFYQDNLEEIEILWKLSEAIKESVSNQIKNIKLFYDKKNNDDTGSYEIRACRGVYLHKNKENKGRAKQHVVVAVFCNKLYSEERTITVAIEIIGQKFIRSCYDNFDKLNINEDLKDKINVNRSWAHIYASSSKVDDFQQIPTMITQLLDTKINGQLSAMEIFERVETYYNSEFNENL